MKTNLDQHFKTDEKLSGDGVEFAIDDKTSFLVRHYSGTNPRVKAATARHYKPYARQADMGTLDIAKQLEIHIKIFIDVCLVSWKGVEIEGKEVEFTPDNAMKLFTRLPNLFDALWRHANDYTNYKEDLGNS